MKGWLSVAGCQLAVVLACGQERHYPLNDGWSFRQAGREQWRSAKVPGVVQTDLLRHGLIPDFMLGSNIDSVQWIEHEDWEYRRTLFVHDTLLRHEHLDLVFKGLDTFAEVYLNDSLIGTADNMFRTWEWDIRDAVRKGGNELKVIFRSPIKEGAKLREAYGIQLPHDSDPSGVSPYIRKAAYQFGWDFCPRLVTSGIWKGVELMGWSGARIVEVRITKPVLEGAYVMERRHVEVECHGCSSEHTVNVRVEGRIAGSTQIHQGIGHMVVPIGSERWWPRGMGAQHRYVIELELVERAHVVQHLNRFVGIVNPRLEQIADSIGTSFSFSVNGRSFFAKGCNLVPPDMLATRCTDSAWVAQVRHMQAAGMNMVRVWAGGVYPPEEFYAACDTAGIVVWQDLMLANLVPAEGAFLENIRTEAWEQARRLQHHPSVAVFCGNNELRVAWHNWGWQDRYDLHGADSARVIDSNEALWKRELASATAGLGHGRYIATSPISNWGNMAGLKHGDLHYWGVWHGDSTFSSYKNNVGRFMSEWGFQSYPDSSLLAKYVSTDSLYLGSPAVKRLQRSYKTDRPIWEAIERELGEERPTTLGGFINASQLVQAKAYRMAIEAHLSARPHCMGTLLWQLNDCWPGPSWSIVDYGGHPKPAYSAVKEVFRRLR